MNVIPHSDDDVFHDDNSVQSQEPPVTPVFPLIEDGDRDEEDGHYDPLEDMLNAPTMPLDEWQQRYRFNPLPGGE